LLGTYRPKKFGLSSLPSSTTEEQLPDPHQFFENKNKLRCKS